MATGESEQTGVPAEILHDVENQLSENEKKGDIGKVLSYIKKVADTGFTVYRIAEAVRALTKMGEFSSRLDKHCTANMEKDDFIKETEDFVAKSVTGTNDIIHLLLTKLSGTEDINEERKIKAKILNTLQDVRKRASEDMIMKSVTGNVYVSAVQILNLYFAWKTISAASNVIEDKNKFTKINSNLERMKSMVAELVDIYERQPKDKSINLRIRKINTLFYSTMSKINTIEVSISGHVQRLEATSDHAAVDALSSTVTAVSQGFQMWSVFADLSTMMKVCGLLSAGVHAVSAVGNVAVVVISQEKMKELRKQLRDAVDLREAMDDLLEKVDAIITL